MTYSRTRFIVGLVTLSASALVALGTLEMAGSGSVRIRAKPFTTRVPQRQSAAPHAAPDQLLPARSRHVFLLVDPTWKVVTEYLEKAREESFLIVPSPVPASKKRVYRSVSYFVPGMEKDPTAFVKMRRYDPDGRLTQEVDQVEGDRFERDFYANGSIGSYSHWRTVLGEIDGVSLDRQGNVIARVVDGSGEQVSWIYRPDDYIRSYLQKGNYYLTKAYLDARLYSVTRWMPNADNLRITAAGEHMALSGAREYWTKPAKGDPYGQVSPDQMLGGKTVPSVKPPANLALSDAIHDRLLARDRNLWPRKPPDPIKEVEQARQDYRTRRSEFMRSYGAWLEQRGLKDSRPELEQSINFKIETRP